MQKTVMQLLFLSLCALTSSGLYAQKPSGVELNCRIEPHLRVDVSSSAEGVVSEVLVEKNDTVKKGDVVARLEASLESATADLRRFQADLQSDIDSQTLALRFSQRNLDRVTNLHKNKAASSAELDKAKTEHELAQQNLQQAKDRQAQAALEYKRAQADLERRIIVSPIDGVVVERFKDPGEHVYFEPLVQIVQIDPLRVEVFAPASLFGLLREEMRAVVTPELGGGRRTITARVSRVDRVIDAPSGTFGIELLVPNPHTMIPSGLKCKVSFPDVTPEVDWLE